MLDVRIHAGVVMLALTLVIGRAQGGQDYSFPHEVGPTITRSLYATVRIFASEDQREQKGSGFIIDGDDGLILTAAHVARELPQIAWIALPKMKARHRAKVLLTSGTEPNAPDLAILQFDPPIGDLDAFEVQFEPMHEDQDHYVTGYGRSNEMPVPGPPLRPGWTNDCLYTFRAEILQGDSGSPILTADGLVDGIAVQGIEHGASDTFMHEVRALPISCVMRQILKFVSDAQNDKIMNTLVKGTEGALRHAFQPPPKPGWVSNLRLAKAVDAWITAHKDHKEILENDRVVSAITIITQRHLDPKTVVDFCRASASSDKEAGDALQRFADNEAKRGSQAIAALAYGEAVNLYLKYVGATSQPSSWWSADPQVFSVQPNLASGWNLTLGARV